LHGKVSGVSGSAFGRGGHHAIVSNAAETAHRWFDEISTGKASSLAEIAAREGLAVRYVGRLIRLAFLAPAIVEAILEGRQPASITTEALTRHIELPLEWRSQKTALNIQ
jgi:site-specific DNA recombinase